MFVNGQHVVCINDTFPPGVRGLYRDLPKRDVEYVVREVYLGTTGKPDDADVGVLLVGLHNPPPPHYRCREEMGFSAHRFAPLLRDLETNVQEKREPAHVG
jgi:hypothetical protein